MAFPTPVNSQITDAVTQSNVKVVGESPALAMGSIYQSLAHSTGILFENAVAAQQQQNVLAQAATNQGVMQIYALDTTAANAASEKIGQTGTTDNLASLLKVLESFRNNPPSLKASAADNAPHSDVASNDTGDGTGDDTAGNSGSDATVVDTPEHDTFDRIRAAVTFSNDTVLGHSPAVIDGVRSAADAMAHALDAMNRVTHTNMVNILLEAALAITLANMIRDPSKTPEYEGILQAIKRMG